MKIAQVVSTFPPYRGGMGNVAYYIAEELSFIGNDVTVFTPKYCFKDSDLQTVFKIYKLLPQFRFGNSAIVLQLAWHLVFKKFKVVHLHYPFMGASLSVILAKILRGKKMKLVVHYHMDLVGKGWRKVVYSIYNYLNLRWIVKLADVILVTSEDYLKNSYMYMYYSKYQAKFKILPNGVDVEKFKPQAKSFSLTNKYSLTGKKVILFVGALDSSHYFKGVNYLIKAAQMLKRDDFKLIIVGEGDLRPVYQDMVESFNLNDQVVFTGYIPDESLVKYYNLADIFVLPSVDQSEAFGMVLLEAMSCAKPVIASDLPGVRKVVNRGVNGSLFKPKQADQLAFRLNELLNNPEECKRYGLAGREKVEKDYSWVKIVKNLEEIYKSI